MKSAIWFVIFCTSFIQNGLCQSVRPQLMIKVDSLLRSGIDTLAYISNDCESPTCYTFECGDSAYILWMKNKQTFVTKIKECERFPIVHISKSVFLDSLVNNVAEIQRECIKPLKIKTGLFASTIFYDHNAWIVFGAFVNGDKVYLRINGVDINPTDFSGYRINRNYEHNARTIQFGLKKVAEEEVAFFEGRKFFTK